MEIVYTDVGYVTFYDNNDNQVGVKATDEDITLECDFYVGKNIIGNKVNVKARLTPELYMSFNGVVKETKV